MTTQTQGTVNTVMMGGLGLMAIGFAVAIVQLMASGHASFNTSSDGITWGLPVVNYVFFALTSTGLTMVSSLAMVFGNKQYYAIAKRCVWLSLVTLIAGFASLAMELGHPFRMLWAIPLSFQLLSPLNWMGIFYAVFLVLGVMKFMKLQAGDWGSDASRTIGIAALVAEVFAAGMLGMAFGSMAMRPMWFGTMVPLFFLLTAASSGAAFALIATYLAYGNEQGMPEKVRALVQGSLPTALAAILGFTIVTIIYQTAIGAWSNADGMQVWDRLLASPWYWLHLAALVAAFYLLIKRSSLLIAAALIVLALFINRYEFVVAGQMVPLFKGSWTPGLIEYTPSVAEWMVTLMAFGIAFGGWALGEKMFKLDEAPKD